MEITIEIEEESSAKLLKMLDGFSGVRIVETKRSMDEILKERIEEYQRNPERFRESSEGIEKLKARIAKRCES